MSQEYEFRSVGPGPEELLKTLQLCKLVWPRLDKLTIQYFTWLYLDNPDGKVIGVNAWNRGELAGHYVVVPARVRLDGEEVPAALSLNTVVHPDHQGRGLFTKLASQTYDLAREKEVDHIFGVANANSTPGLIKRLGFQLVAPLQTKVFLTLPTINQKTSDLQWERVWRNENLGWRLKNPSFQYRFLKKGGSEFFFTRTGYPGLQSIVKIGDDLGINHGLRPVNRLAPFKLWLGLDPDIRSSILPGVALPKQLKRSPLNLIFRSLSSPGKLLDKNRVRFGALNFDTF